jgi:hypothetical protein
VLFEQIQKCFVGEFLKVLHAIACEEIKSMQCLVVELNTLPWQPLLCKYRGMLLNAWKFRMFQRSEVPKCSMEQTAASGGAGPTVVPCCFRNGSSGGAAGKLPT